MIPRMAQALLPALFLLPGAAPQPRNSSVGVHRMEISLERLDATTWHTVDPELVLAQGDRVRFRFRTSFDGYLYVMNQSSSGKYEQLFPRAETGLANNIAANTDYQIPATSSVFRIAGPPGFEVVYWLVTPRRLTDALPHLDVPIAPAKPLTLIPRCDDTILKARGDCIDTSAGPKLVPRGEPLPDNLAAAAGQGSRDLLFMRQQNSSVIASTEPLTGPVLYEFRVAHK
jgi:hypothetical protein